MDNKENTINVNFIDFYKLITFILFIFVVIFSYYFQYINIFSPLIFLIIIYVIRLIKINNICDKSEDIPYINLLYRSLTLLCIYLYSEYTVKCIPILNLIFNKIFEFPITGKILKSFFSYLLLEFGDNILNNFNNLQSKNFLDDICNIKQDNNNLYLILITLGIVIVNTYIQNVRDNL
jgi:hypothetical protein